MANEDKMKWAVYLDFVNYLGEVTDSFKIAEFRSHEWANAFIKGCDDFSHYRIEKL